MELVNKCRYISMGKLQIYKERFIIKHATYKIIILKLSELGSKHVLYIALEKDKISLLGNTYYPSLAYN